MIVRCILVSVHFKRLKRANIELFNTIKELDARNKLLNESIQNQGILIKEVHHRVKNNLQIVGSLLRLQSSE